MNKFPHLLLLGCMVMLTGPPGLSAADFAFAPGISRSGFGTLGFVHNSTSGVADDWSGNVDSRFGLQLNTNLSPGWDLGPYLWARPPVDFFGQLLLSYFDDGAVVFTHEVAGGLVSAKAYGGRNDQIIPIEGGDDFSLSGSTTVGGNLSFRKGDWLIRVGHTHASIDDEMPNLVPLHAALRGTGSSTATALARHLGLSGKAIRIIAAGAAWEHGPWQAQFMYGQVSSTAQILATSNSGYFMLGYRRGKWSSYLMVAETVPKDQHAETGLSVPNPLDTALGTILEISQSKQQTFSLGLRYDIMHNADLKLQVGRTHVYDQMVGMWRNSRPDWNADATLFTLALDYVF